MSSSKSSEVAQVVIRVKPATAGVPLAVTVPGDTPQPTVCLTQRTASGDASNLSFPVNGCIQGSDQQSVYAATAADLVACATKDGYSTALLAYGQTGT